MGPLASGMSGGVAVLLLGGQLTTTLVPLLSFLLAQAVGVADGRC